ncbi:uncharacterized protein LOC135479186 isoform X2 [Liolophura sinensis]|uniref:uncharacterized protein LOC135479186 isoform X2 n=1 Tax=Liolophura sinensis TaxID=3198878 RepID=UPI0031591D5E
MGLRSMANKPKAEPGYPSHEGEDPMCPNKLKLNILSSQERPELIVPEPDDDDPDFEGLDDPKSKPGQRANTTSHPAKAKKPEAKDNTQKK